MARLLKGFQETSEERALRLRKATIQRVRILAVICSLAILLRVFIKNPPPPKPPDMSKVEIRYVPGMLDNMSAATLKKMDPVLLARLQKAEIEARRNSQRPLDMYGQGIYQPAEPPVENPAEEEKVKQILFAYAKKREFKLREKQKQETADLTKPMLVLFTSGGHVKAEKAEASKRVCEIRIDRTILARLPKQMVYSVSDNAATWKPRIPQGFVRVQPAKGITITLSKKAATRISTKKPSYDET